MADRESWLVSVESADYEVLVEMLANAGYRIEQVGPDAYDAHLLAGNGFQAVSLHRCNGHKHCQADGINRALFSAIPDLIFKISCDHRLVATNKESSDQFYLQPSEFLSKSLHEVLPRDVADLIVEKVDTVLETGERCICDYSLEIGDELRHFECRMAPCGDGVIAVSSDVTDRKRAEHEQRILAQAYHLMRSSSTLHELAHSIAVLVKEYSCCEAVGIRLRDGYDYPYWEVCGFSDEFIGDENRLCAVDENGDLIVDSDGRPLLECLCGIVIQGRTDPSLPFFTEFGSFWTNSTSRLVSGCRVEKLGARMRGRCNTVGYESVALVPLCAAGERFGLLQFNDRRPGRFSIERVKAFEKIAEGLASSLAHRHVVEALRKSEASLMAAQSLVHLGSYEFSLIGGEGFCSGETAGILGLEPDSQINLDAYYQLIHPEDRLLVRNTMNEVIVQRHAHELDFRLLLPGGTAKYVHSVAQAVPDSYGRVDKLFGTLMDITERKQTERELADAREELEKAYRREHHIADVLQHALIPRVDFSADGYHVLARYLPALDEAEVGGDFYDVFRLRDGKLALVIGDVSGKGLTAAVHTAMLKYTIQAYAHEDPTPSSVLERVNRTIHDSALDDLFITAFYGVLDTGEGLLTYANAGHDLPLHYIRSSNETVPLGVTGRAVGFLRDSSYGQSELSLAPGDALVLYTDGITDARCRGNFFEIEGLSRVVVANAASSNEQLVESVLKAALDISSGKLHDDCAMLVVKRES